jgi:hypothetical protein
MTTPQNQSAPLPTSALVSIPPYWLIAYQKILRKALSRFQPAVREAGRHSYRNSMAAPTVTAAQVWASYIRPLMPWKARLLTSSYSPKSPLTSIPYILYCRRATSLYYNFTSLPILYTTSSVIHKHHSRCASPPSSLPSSPWPPSPLLRPSPARVRLLLLSIRHNGGPRC